MDERPYELQTTRTVRFAALAFSQQSRITVNGWLRNIPAWRLVVAGSLRDTLHHAIKWGRES